MLRSAFWRAEPAARSVPPLPGGDRLQPPPATAEAANPANVRTLYLLQGAYLILLFAVFTIRGVGLTPDTLFLLLAAGFAWRGNRWPFLRCSGARVLPGVTPSVEKGSPP
jgi:hypothetical protein